MSIPNINEVGRLPKSTSRRIAPASAALPTRKSDASTTASATKSTEQSVPEQPSPPRFPWLSRLSRQLESVAKQKPAFASAPVLGDNIDKSA